jgi:hypothetical protein
MIKLIIFLFPTFFSGKPANLEQTASDYFFDNIFRENYNEYKIIEFETQTDTSQYWGVVNQCKAWDEATKSQILSAKPDAAVSVKANRTGIRIKKIRKNSARLKVYVYSNIHVGSNYFVLVAAYRKLRFAEYYFIKFDEDGNIIETCKAGEII